MESFVLSRRVCIVGAGYISQTHAEALQSLAIPVVAVVDPNRTAREKLARAWNIPNAFESVDQLLASCGFDRAHVVVPPDSHETVAFPLLASGKAVLIEKPLATTSRACSALNAAASRPEQLGVNQNFVYHPTFARLREAVTRGDFGTLRFVNVIYRAPLRQLAARQFSHWMFREPRNILLEQAVHPLSLLAALCGRIERVEAIGNKPIEIAPDVPFYPSFSASLVGEQAHAGFHFAVGENFPVWQVSAYCDDGVLVADLLSDRNFKFQRTRWIDAVDGFVSSQRMAFALARDGVKNLTHYGLSTVKLQARSDGFFLSMRESIKAFHNGVDSGKPILTDGAFGKSLVETCDEIASQIMPPAARPARAQNQEPPEKVDIAVLGGTGFIGRAVVSRLRRAGLTVSVMARNLQNLPAAYGDPGVRLVGGSIGSSSDVLRAIADAPCVINLAHGGGGDGWEQIRDAMVGGAETVGRACLSGSKRLIHVGSIASLYLGPQKELITGSTRPDPDPSRRAFYARAKVACDELLMDMHHRDGLAVSIFRPGLVVGEGTTPFHSGLGFYNTEQHCLGWNAGRNPLPFVLVDDVAEALLLAYQALDLSGKAYNLVGDVRPSAREFLAELAQVSHRPLKFHGQSPYGLYLSELGKWFIKVIARRGSPPPYLHDFRSRGLTATFDCSDVKHHLGWQPVSDRATFFARAFQAYAAQ